MRHVVVRAVPKAAVTLSAALVVVGAFGPWLLSGSSTRNSFDLIDLVERLGFSPGGVFEITLLLWPLVPLLAVGTCVAVWADRTRWGLAIGSVTALYPGGVALAVTQAPDSALVRIGWGPSATSAGTIMLLATMASWFVAGRSARPETAVDQHLA